MKGIFLGTGGYHPSERRHTAGILLPELGIALDAGTGFFRMPDALKTETLNILLTHAHLDHIVGLSFPLVAMGRQQITQITVHGTADVLNAVKQHLFSPALFPIVPDFDWVELPDGEFSIGDSTIRWCSLEHPGGSVGYQIENRGRKLSYITDTTAPGNYTDFIHGSHLLIHECYFPDDMSDWAASTGHSCATPVANVARQAKAERLLLVHTDPQTSDDDPVGLQAMREIFPATELAEDLMEFTV